MTRRSEAGCDGKVKFATWGLADQAVRARKKGHHGHKDRCVYRCSSCGSFHIGTQLGGAKRGRRQRIPDTELA